ncbi:MAG: alpha-ribazole phosphatase [Pseudomonadota bacterium]|nr:alpha-ribazole phosphatase [Pseudomonadota bacterium]MDQ5916267.1 alpha-ribazole phosphatase [Pseudomonadota bacterium]
MQVFLIRHPRPQVADGVCYGQLDLPALGVEQTAAALRTQLPTDLPLISSPLQRCRALAEALHPAPRLEAGLMEMNFGEWEGKRWDEISIEALDAWAANLLHHAPPGGESAAMLQARSVACLNTLAAEGLSACVVVTHAGVMRAAVGHAQQLPATAWSQLKFDYGKCVLLSWPAAD